MRKRKEEELNPYKTSKNPLKQDEAYRETRAVRKNSSGSFIFPTAKSN